MDPTRIDAVLDPVIGSLVTCMAHHQVTVGQCLAATAEIIGQVGDDDEELSNDLMHYSRIVTGFASLELVLCCPSRSPRTLEQILRHTTHPIHLMGVDVTAVEDPALPRTDRGLVGDSRILHAIVLFAIFDAYRKFGPRGVIELRALSDAQLLVQARENKRRDDFPLVTVIDRMALPDGPERFNLLTAGDLLSRVDGRVVDASDDDVGRRLVVAFREM